MVSYYLTGEAPTFSFVKKCIKFRKGPRIKVNHPTEKFSEIFFQILYKNTQLSAKSNALNRSHSTTVLYIVLYILVLYILYCVF